MTFSVKVLFYAALVSGTGAATAQTAAPDPAAPPAPALSTAAQTADVPANGGSDPKAIDLMKQMVAALGPKWMGLHNTLEEGRTSGFFHGESNGSIGDFRTLRTVPTSMTDPGLQRTELTKKHNVVDILLPDQYWEITYRGKRLIPPEEYLSTFRRRDHSLDEAVRVWWHQPGLVLLSGGEKMVERHLIDEITLLTEANDNITLDMDAETHLPFRVAFTWRDPLYKDNNEDAEEFADYHPIDGIPTPLNESFYHNGEMTSQRYLTHVSYNVSVAPDAFDVDATVRQIVPH